MRNCMCIIQGKIGINGSLPFQHSSTTSPVFIKIATLFPIKRHHHPLSNQTVDVHKPSNKSDDKCSREMNHNEKHQRVQEIIPHIHPIGVFVSNISTDTAASNVISAHKCSTRSKWTHLLIVETIWWRKGWERVGRWNQFLWSAMKQRWREIEAKLVDDQRTKSISEIGAIVKPNPQRWDGITRHQKSAHHTKQGYQSRHQGLTNHSCCSVNIAQIHSFKFIHPSHPINPQPSFINVNLLWHQN